MLEIALGIEWKQKITLFLELNKITNTHLDVFNSFNAWSMLIPD